MMKGGWPLKMKAWVKPGLDTLNVSMTMNSNALNGVIVSAAEVPTNPVETPIPDENNGNVADGIDAVNNNASGENNVDISNNSNETNEPNDSKEPIVEDNQEVTNETEQETAPTEPSPEEENCAAVETSTESETNSLFTEEAVLFNKSSPEISEEFQIEGGCSTVLGLGGEDAEEMEKAIAALMLS